MAALTQDQTGPINIYQLSTTDSMTVVQTIVLLLLTVQMSCTDDPIRSQGSGTISGRVLHDPTGAVVAGAMLTTAPASISILSDSTGSYTINTLVEGQYNVTASKTGFVSTSAIVLVQPGETTVADFSLANGINLSPNQPTNRLPIDGASDVPASEVTLSWSGSDPDEGDSLTYDVRLFGPDGTSRVLSTGQSDTSTVASDLLFGTTYFWQITSRDNHGSEQGSSVFAFTTELPPQHPVLFAAKLGNNYDIYSAGTQSLDDRLARLTREPSAELWPRVSPDGSRIAFSSDRTGEPQIYIMGNDVAEPFQLTTLPVSGFHNRGIGFGWSSDGTQMLYGHYDRLYRIDTTGGNLVLLATAPAGRHFREVDWSPLGNRLAVLTVGTSRYDAEIYLLDVDGTNMTLLVGNDPGGLSFGGFSADGARILYSYDMSGFENNTGRQLDAHLFTIQLDGTGLTDLSAGKSPGTNDTYPRWSPDGASVVFENTRNDGSELSGLWTLQVATPSVRRPIVTEGSMPDWR